MISDGANGSPEQSAETMAEALAQASAQQAFKLFQNRHYRRSARLEALNTVNHREEI